MHLASSWEITNYRVINQGFFGGCGEEDQRISCFVCSELPKTRAQALKSLKCNSCNQKFQFRQKYGSECLLNIVISFKGCEQWNIESIQKCVSTPIISYL